MLTNYDGKITPPPTVNTPDAKKYFDIRTNEYSKIGIECIYCPDIIIPSGFRIFGDAESELDICAHEIMALEINVNASSTTKKLFPLWDGLYRLLMTSQSYQPHEPDQPDMGKLKQ